MRAETKGKHGMGKRFALVIGVAAAGVMALGAQTGAQTQAPTPTPPTCKGLAATIVGTEGPDDLLNGTPGRDVIVALGGDDGRYPGSGDFRAFGVYGGAGNDVICGGPGNDVLIGGQGKDTLLGQRGHDWLAGEGGKDSCNGGKGNDSTPSTPAPVVCEVEKSIEKSVAH